jgi:dTMP kinase
MAAKLITIEGIEGAGKSTVIQYLQNYWQHLGSRLVITREPGGTKLAEAIRELLLQPQEKEQLCPKAELLLLFASRAQHMATVITPALAAGCWVICDRFIDASYAYQYFGRELNYAHVAFLEQLVLEGLQPNLTILLDLDPAIGLARARQRSQQDRFEQETLAFFTKVRYGYLQLAEQYPQRFRVIDASQPLAKVQEQLQQIIALEHD